MNAEDIVNCQEKLLHWYQNHQRPLPWRKSDNPYHIWVSEVMLQQTQVKTVIPYYLKFIKKFPSIKSLANSDIQEVLKSWEGLGYYARARNFHKAAKIVLKEYDGKIPRSKKDFQRLPGVGEYIASAVLSIAFQQNYAVVEGNVKRVLARLFLLDAPVNKANSNKIFKHMADKLIDPQRSGNFNQALMELGAIICKPQIPVCNRCPIKGFCAAYQARKVAEYPKKEKGRPIPEYHIAVGVVYRNGLVLITRRNLNGLLGGLWEFPGGKVKNDENPEAACKREIKEEVNLSVDIDKYITRVKHAYTHFKIVMDVFRCDYQSGRVKLKGSVDYRWIKLGEIDQYPFPKANHKFIPYL